MLREVKCVESQPAIIELADDGAALLAGLGRQLASYKAWWGESVDHEDRTVISVNRISAQRCRVTFRDVIGVVRLPGCQIQVEPKIPANHFFYIAQRSELAPRLASADVKVDGGTAFVEVLARWFLDAVEQLLRLGLRKDYKTVVEELQEVRGHLFSCETLMESLRGRAVAICEFDDLSDDAPLNRIVLGACQRLARIDAISKTTRSRARKAAYRMDGVGPIQPTDLRVRVDRVSSSYARVVPLALLVLSGCGISSTVGQHVGAAFLVRTPELIEDGLRAVVTESVPDVAVTKRRLQLGDSGISMNPDLVFGDDIAVGDVKYRFLKTDWNRPDLNQVVAFATALRCSRCVVLGFVREESASLPKSVPVGPVLAASLGWVASIAIDPADSAHRLQKDVVAWLTGSS